MAGCLAGCGVLYRAVRARKRLLTLLFLAAGIRDFAFCYRLADRTPAAPRFVNQQVVQPQEKKGGNGIRMRVRMIVADYVLRSE